MLKHLATLLASVLIAAGLLVLPASAPASAAPSGTIVFIRDHNVWMVRADGSGLYQVTRDGTAATPYASPTMSDAGIIAAGHGPHVVRMRQNGSALNRFDPPPLTNSAGGPVDGALNYVAISPDGARIAYGWSRYSCPIGVSCQVRSASAVTSAGGFTGATTTSYLHHPSWVGNQRLMVHGGYLSQVMLQNVGGAAQHWFDDQDVFEPSTDLGDASLSRDGSRLVAIRGYGAETQMVWYDVSGDPRTAAPASLPAPSGLCIGSPGAGPTDERLHDPAWSPDGTAFAIGATEGIWVVTTGPDDCTGVDVDLLGRGTSPHWSPAALNPGPRASGGGVTTFTAKAPPAVSGKARVGKRLKATIGRWAPTPTTVRYTWLRNGKPIRKATGATYKVVRKDRRKKISVRVTVSRAGLPTAAATSRSVKVR